MKAKSKTLEKVLKSKFYERKWTQKKSYDKFHQYEKTLESTPKEYDKFDLEHLKKYDKFSDVKNYINSKHKKK